MALRREQDGNNSDIQTLLTMLSCCGELNLDSKALAAAFGIARTDNALRKVKLTLERHAYKFDQGKVIKIDGDGYATAAETPKKTPEKGNTTKTTPKSKKRKLDDDNSEENVKEAIG